jgi:CheY-like chemotaxis protein
MNKLPRQPDLVLLDLMLPDMDGWQVYHTRADQAIQHIPVIVITPSQKNRYGARRM